MHDAVEMYYQLRILLHERLRNRFVWIDISDVVNSFTKISSMQSKVFVKLIGDTFLLFSLALKRFPIDTNDPVGFLIAFTVAYIIIAYEALIIASASILEHFGLQFQRPRRFSTSYTQLMIKFTQLRIDQTIWRRHFSSSSLKAMGLWNSWVQLKSSIKWKFIERFQSLPTNWNFFQSGTWFFGHPSLFSWSLLANFVSNFHSNFVQLIFTFSPISDTS